MIVISKKIATKAKEAFDADGINVVQNNGQHAGQLVNHIHIHVIPRFPEDKVIITYQRQQVPENELNEVQKALAEGIETAPAAPEPREEPMDFAPKQDDDDECEL